MVAPLSILLLSEDRASDAIPTLKALIVKMLYAIAPDLHLRFPTFEPLSSPDAIYISNGHLWKSTDPRDFRRQKEFVREIATKLAEGERSFVFYHIDGDMPWASSRDGALCGHVSPLMQFLSDRISTIIPRCPNENNTADALIRAIRSRLLLIVPYYSIEAWLYQNSAVFQSLCQKHHGNQHMTALKRWETEPGLLDEVVKPKEASCIGSKYNKLLAEQTYPARKVQEVGKSFAAAIGTLKACKALMVLLRPNDTSEDPA